MSCQAFFSASPFYALRDWAAWLLVVGLLWSQPSHAQWTNSQADCLFDWGAVTYPNELKASSKPVSQSTADYYYRHYAQSNNYVGVSQKDDRLYFMVGATGQLSDLGPVSTWLSTARCVSSIGSVRFSSQPPASTTEPFARFSFEASGATGYECSLDGAAWATCSSPLQLPTLNSRNQYDRLAIGSRLLAVRGTAAGLSPGPSSEARWTITSIFSSNSPDFQAKRLIDAEVLPTAVTTGGWKGIQRINCEFDHAAYDDPVGKPGQPSQAALYAFYGHKNVDAQLNFDKLISSSSAGCSGDTLNRSGYWMPVLLAPQYDYTTGQRLKDSSGQDAWTPVLAKVGEGDRSAAAAHEVFYYSAGVSDVNSIWAPPLGLRMIAGRASTAPGQTAQSTSIVRWHCQTWNSSDAAGGPWSSTIPECTAPDMLRMDIFFPSCWNGRDLDAADHASHMAYPVSSGNANVCPSTHPYPIVRVSYHFAYPLFPGQLDPVTKTSKGFRLASDPYTVSGNNGGLSLHGVWFNGWHPEAMDMLLKGCVRGQRDCHDGNFAMTAAGSGTGGSWAGSVSLGGLANAKGTEAIPAIVNQGRGMP
jgi:hypothetical protein